DTDSQAEYRAAAEQAEHYDHDGDDRHEQDALGADHAHAGDDSHHDDHADERGDLRPAQVAAGPEVAEAQAEPQGETRVEAPVAAAVEASVAATASEVPADAREAPVDDERAEEERTEENVAHADDAPHDEIVGALHATAAEGELVSAPVGDEQDDESEED